MIGIEKVLVVSPETEHHVRINAATHKCGLRSFSCKKIDEALLFLSRQKFSVVFCNDVLPDGDFRGVLALAKPTPVVVLSRFVQRDCYLAALRDGAFDYIACPPNSAETERIVWSAIGKR